MRPIERIDNFLQKVDWNLLFMDWELLFDNKQYYNIEDFEKLFVPYWKANPDQRIGQVLINLAIVPDKMDVWDAEESDILMKQGIAPEDCLFWTSIYGQDGKELEVPVSRLVSTLSKEHITRIFEFMKLNNGRIREQMTTALNNTLKKLEQ